MRSPFFAEWVKTLVYHLSKVEQQAADTSLSNTLFSSIVRRTDGVEEAAGFPLPKRICVPIRSAHKNKCTSFEVGGAIYPT